MLLKDFFKAGYLQGKYPSTDKDTSHNYITSYYCSKLSSKRLDNLTLVEIGVYKMDSLKLFRDFFVNAKIIGIDKWAQVFDSDLNEYVVAFESNKYYSYFVNNKSDTILEGCEIYALDAYNIATVNLFKDESVDIIIEDGSHFIEDQLFVLREWITKLKKEGILVIEDIQKEEHLYLFKAQAEKLNCGYTIYDLRSEDRSYDNILIEIVKR